MTTPGPKVNREGCANNGIERGDLLNLSNSYFCWKWAFLAGQPAGQNFEVVMFLWLRRNKILSVHCSVHNKMLIDINFDFKVHINGSSFFFDSYFEFILFSD